MGLQLYCLALVLVSASATSRNEKSIAYQIKEAFEDYALSSIVAPPQLLKMRFGPQVVRLGTQLCAFETVYYPFVSFEANPKSLNTLYCFNPDVAYYSKGTFDLSYLITLVVNIPGEDFNSGDVLIDYKCAPSPIGAGATRNICLVHKQPKEINVSTDLLVRLSKNLLEFNRTDFVQEYRLGDPIAGNFYLFALTLCESDGNGNQLQCGSCAANYFAY